MPLWKAFLFACPSDCLLSRSRYWVTTSHPAAHTYLSLQRAGGETHDEKREKLKHARQKKKKKEKEKQQVSDLHRGSNVPWRVQSFSPSCGSEEPEQRTSSSTQEEPSYRSISPPRGCSLHLQAPPPPPPPPPLPPPPAARHVTTNCCINFHQGLWQTAQVLLFAPLWTYYRIFTGWIIKSKPRSSFTQVQFWGTLHEYFHFLLLYTSTTLHSGGKTSSVASKIDVVFIQHADRKSLILLIICSRYRHRNICIIYFNLYFLDLNWP